MATEKKPRLAVRDLRGGPAADGQVKRGGTGKRERRRCRQPFGEHFSYPPEKERKKRGYRGRRENFGG